ncbi:MAG: PAS domain S-box protein, partial [Smithella sp.]
MAAKRCRLNTLDKKNDKQFNNIPSCLTDGEKSAILESIPGPIILVDTDFNVTWSNSALNKLLNLSANQLEGRHCFEKIHGLKEPCKICPVKKVIDSGLPCTVDDVSYAGKKWMMQAYPLRDENGKITRIVEIGTDISESKHTERKKIIKQKDSEKELKKLSKLQSVILDNSSIGIAFVRNRTYEWVNKKMSELYGIPVEQLQGSSTRIIYPSDEIYERAGLETYSLFAQGKNVSLETPSIKGDGSLIWCKIEGIVLDHLNPQNGSIWIAEDITKRKKAEDSLRKSEEKYRGLIEGLNEALFRMTLPDGRFEYFSPSVTNVLGYSAEKIIANPSLIKQAIHPDFQNFINEEFKKLKDGKISPNFEYKIIDSEGKERWIIQSNKGIFDDKGHLVALEGLCRDISIRKRAEDALRDSEKKYRRLHESMTEAFASVDMNGFIQEANNAYQSMLGYSEEELRELKYLDITPPKWHRLEKKIIEEQILTQGYAGIYEKEFQRKDGSVFPVELSTFMIRDDSGNPACMWAIVHDITKRKQMEKELEATKDYLRTVFNNVYDAIMIHDLNGKVIDVNDKMLEMYRISRDEAVNLNIIRDYSVTDESMEESKTNWNKIISGQNMFLEWKARRPKDGSLFDVEVFLTKLALPDGNYILANIRDITRRKQMEEERGRIEVRMREVQKLESLGVLAGGIAHDFNNLLMAIMGRADMAILSISPESPAFKHLEEIMKASHRAADLCRQMLAYSGKGLYMVSNHDISKIIREMRSMIDASIAGDVIVQYNLSNELPEVELDVTQIRQVIINLIKNASDALGNMQGIISVATGIVECDEACLSESYLDHNLSGGIYIYLEISDTGCGMDSEIRSRIFDPFFSTKFTGRGLGLAAVLGIVRGHKGVIKVNSEVEKGTSFKILLPAIILTAEKKDINIEYALSLKKNSVILLIDDDPCVL